MTERLLLKLKVILLHYEKMGFWNATSYIAQRIFKRNKYLTAKIKNTGLNIRLRNDKYDTQVFTQIFMREELNVHFEQIPKIIIDGGANIGLSTLYLKNKYPKASIIAIEPERSNFKLLTLNTKNYSDIFCLNKGIWNTSGILQIIDKGDGNASFITKEMSISETAENVVSAINLEDIMSQFGINVLDLLKLDIEGSEKEVFEKKLS